METHFSSDPLTLLTKKNNTIIVYKLYQILSNKHIGRMFRYQKKAVYYKLRCSI